jgi:hypothetical protein
MSTNLYLFIKKDDYESQEVFTRVTKKLLRFCKYNNIVYFVNIPLDNDNILNITLNNTYTQSNDNEIKKIILD